MEKGGRRDVIAGGKGERAYQGSCRGKEIINVARKTKGQAHYPRKTTGVATRLHYAEVKKKQDGGEA